MSNTTRRRYNERFLEELERLNPAQREAVDHIEGPVLVIAGPGTGKTHILTARIGRILLETDAQAHNILCLTFTDAGVHAMRERLLAFIGPEAHRVHIYTFHSFCNSIIQDNLELFGRHDLEPLTDLERVEIIRRLIDHLPVDHPLKRGRSDVFFYEAHLYDLFKRMKSENWTVAYVHQKIDDYLTDLPNRREFVYQISRGDFKKGDLKAAKVEEAEERMDRLRAAAALYPEYQEAMRAARRYDYDDMILWVLRAFEENESLLRTYQEQYLYLLIDEYQDTNGAQNEIIRKLVAYWSNPNLFIVGDDDQSIYEFQGARLKNLTDFYYNYQKEVKLILLNENYRSSQHILDSSLALIHHNERRIINSLQELGVEKVLTARSEEVAGTKVRPQLLVYPNRAQEEAGIVFDVEKLYKEGFPLEEVAIVYARHRQARNLITLFEKKDIPYNTRRKVNVLDLPMIRNLRSFLEYLRLEFERPHNGEYRLFRILHFKFLGIAPADLARLSVYQASFDWSERPRWRDLLRDEQQLQKLQLSDPQLLAGVTKLIDELLSDYTSMSVAALIERLINRCGLLRQVIEHPDKVWQIQVLNTFFNFVRQESDRHPRLSLRQLLEVLDRMDDNRLPIEVSKTITAGNGVNLLTAHSAKGLEFQRVYILDCVKDQWEPRNRGSSYRFSFPDTLTFSGEEDALEARRRLFFVAMTRAKEQLHISYSEQDYKEKDLQRAVFVDELASAAGLEARKVEVPEEVQVTAQFLQLLELERPAIPVRDKAVVDALLEGFTLSVSALNRYLSCPLSFYYENVLRAPVLVSEAANYGTAAHNALQRLFERMLLAKSKRFPSEMDFLSLFEYEMKKLQAYFSRREFDRRLETGKQHLSRFYRHYIDQWHKWVKVEFTIRNVEMDGVPMTGTIDKLEYYDPSKARIVDYKTGSHSQTKIKRPTSANPNGGSYWRQLVFYKILFEQHDNHLREVSSGSIVYLEPDTSGNFPEETINFRPKDVSAVRELIKDTYGKIMRHDFYEGCGRTFCPWCNFVRENLAVDSFSERDIEELDD